MSRFEDAPRQVVSFVEGVQEKNFPALDTAMVKVMFDTKKRKSGKKYVFARIKKTNDELKAFAVNETGQSYDYIMFIDKLIWEALEEVDRDRLVFHEFCHCETNFESDTNQYKIQDHEIQTFYSEIEYCADDPRWAERVAIIAESVHDPENSEE